MKKFLTLSFTFVLTLTAMTGSAQRYGNIPKTAASAPCQDFQKKNCLRSPDEGFTYNGQSKSGLFSKGQQSTLKAVFYKGMDYHISVCTEPEGKKGQQPVVNFQIKDAKTGEMLYDNATDNNTPEIQITNENTRNVNIIVVLPGGDGKKDMVKGTEGVCAGLLIEHRRSDKTGF